MITKGLKTKGTQNDHKEMQMIEKRDFKNRCKKGNKNKKTVRHSKCKEMQNDNRDTKSTKNYHRETLNNQNRCRTTTKLHKIKRCKTTRVSHMTTKKQLSQGYLESYRRLMLFSLKSLFT